MIGEPRPLTTCLAVPTFVTLLSEPVYSHFIQPFNLTIVLSMWTSMWTVYLGALNLTLSPPATEASPPPIPRIRRSTCKQSRHIGSNIISSNGFAFWTSKSLGLATDAIQSSWEKIDADIGRAMHIGDKAIQKPCGKYSISRAICP